MPVKTTIVATFAPGFFLENIATTSEGGMFINCANRQELYYFRPPAGPNDVGTNPILIHKFAADQWAMGIVQAPNNANVFYLLTCDMLSQGSRKCYLHVLDVSYPALGCQPRPILTFPPEAKGLNGMCALSEKVLIVADSFASCIWRVDLDSEQFPPKTAQAKVWLSHPTMAGELHLPDFQPGVNGLKYSAVTGRAYYTNTQLKLFCQAGVNEETLEADGTVEILAQGMQGDDLIVDDETASGPVAYVTTHRDNIILGIPLDERHRKRATSDIKTIVEGNEHDDTMLGPTAGSWAVGKVGKVAYFTTDGGLKNLPNDGRVRAAKVVRVDFEA